VVAQGRSIALEAGIAYTTINGVNVAVDKIINIYVNGRHYTSLVGSPVNLEEIGLGIAVSDLLVDDIRLVKVKTDGENVFLDVGKAESPSTRRAFIEDCSILSVKESSKVNGVVMDWSRILEAIKDFSNRTASRALGVAAHSIGLYDESAQPLLVAHDTSRHTAALKLIGIIVKHGIKTSNTMVITTGRASSDIVVRLGMAGVPVIVTLRGPLDSGVKAALKMGITLIANSRIRGAGRKFVVLTHGYRVRNT